MSSLNLKELKIEVVKATEKCKSNWSVTDLVKSKLDKQGGISCSLQRTSILLQEAEDGNSNGNMFCSLQLKAILSDSVTEMSAELDIEQVESLIDGLEKMRKSMILSKADKDRAKRLINAKSV